MQLIGFNSVLGDENKDFTNYIHNFKCQSRISKTESDLERLYVECNYMTKDISKILETSPKYFLF